MRILVFYPYIPWPVTRGTFHRTFNLLRELARTHEVDFLALAENGEGMEHKVVFETFCRKVEFVSFQHPAWQKLFPDRLGNWLPSNVAHWTLPQAALAVDRMLAGNEYDLVHVCDIVLLQYFRRKHRTVRVTVDRSRVDLQFQLMEHARMNFSLRERLLRFENYAKLWFYEREVARRVSLEVVCGPDDETFIHRFISKRAPVAVVNNGVDLNYFCPTEQDDESAPQPTVLFCGAMDYNPNIDALRWYFQEIHNELCRRVPELRVNIVGKSPVAEVQAYDRKPGVVVTGRVPDVRPYYRSSWMQIVPLRIGGGTRLKIVESLAIGTPVVSTSTGAQGLHLTHGKNILLADTPEAFVTETERALRDPALRLRLQAAGLKEAQSRFSWGMLGRQLSDIYEARFVDGNDKAGNPRSARGMVQSPAASPIQIEA